MEKLFSLTYQGKTFNQREVDNYVNIGQMCANHNKKLGNWKQTKSAQAYLEALAESLTTSHCSYSSSDLIVTTIGGSEGSQTWGHPLVAIEIGRWISPNFGVWCNQHIKQLMETGTTSTQTTETDPILALLESARITRERQLELERRQRKLEEEQLQAAKERKLIAAQQESVRDRQNQVEAELQRIELPTGDYFTIVGYFNLKNTNISLIQAQRVGRRCSKYCRRQGITIERVTDPRFGTVHSYPAEVIEYCVEELSNS